MCSRTRRDEGDSSEPVWSGSVPTSLIIYFLRSPLCSLHNLKQLLDRMVSGTAVLSGACTFSRSVGSGASRKVGKHS